MLLKDLIEGERKKRSAVVVPKQKKESPQARRQREMRNHRFSDYIGGHSSNYRK